MIGRGPLMAVILLLGYGALLSGMALAPTRMGAPVVLGSAWSLLLVLSVLLFFVQLVMVLLFAQGRRS